MLTSSVPSKTLNFNLGPSPRLGILLGGVHLCALLLLLLLPISVWLSVSALFILSVSFFFCLHYQILRKAPKAVVAITALGSAHWRLLLQNGEQCEATLAMDSFVALKLVILNFKLPGRFFRKSVIVIPDALSDSAFRQLRAYLFSCSGGA